MQIDDILDRAHVVALPLAVKFRGITTREALLIDGPAGWGEFSPFVEYQPEEAAHWLAAGLEAAYDGFPESVRDTVEVNGTIPAVAAEQVPEVMARYPGVRTWKVKVAEPGQSLEEDIARVAAVREYAAVHTPNLVSNIRVDANGGWSVDEAIEAAKNMMPLDYMEQPCRTTEELAQVRSQLMRAGLFVRVAADESIRKASDPYRVAQLQAADVAIVKPAPLGGVRNTLDIARNLRDRHMDITVASALDTAVGISMGLATVAALPRIFDDEDIDVVPAAAGLATGSLFLEDVAAPRALIDGSLPAAPIAADPDRLAALAAPAERKDWWFERVRECFAVLDAK
ncbi:o-succinylbenzoate synthase [Corynebacterium ammoniagenes]|uniref:o-succinylbenzoate synthase n=2 Tax=Corynebacterium ammoniagenes TaxID=1697 RepID=A0AAV5G5T8_CORAM|nr:o-succinylbenzoate synthase [Corynebacterium ammoniagenes]APT81781.1 O-succinylbenzoate synthase [Corynebacterium ammoniagenes DSM 20306]AQS72895.1 O-succinylbenzoate synthase [Corynebacterium ammoniagenes]EFG81042.1 mandelate racemase/muconate lactonizing enzyme, C-terminal domain protein [Corynebacterium ammoniagenes DSM 20306]NMF32594.1 o-succinylbenzoate synthase [Corynebacterium ammoniagenes]GJN41590.1 o-succinylbenzoate synthase [Corynebacterium ammoniagenes]